MGFAKSFKNLSELPEVKELIQLFLKRRYSFYYCDDSGLRMQKRFTEIHFLLETDRLRLCIHDDGMGEKETDKALKLASEVVIKYGYKQGVEKLDSNGYNISEESDDEYYKYF